MNLNSSQTEAVAAVTAWLAQGAGRPFVLGGLAGTGKTTLLKHLNLPADTRYVCPTWKAAKVLQKKLGLPVTSIHRLLYNPRGLLHDLDCANLLGEECNMACDSLAWDYSPKERPSLLVVDEASMVGQKVRRDLERLGCPILYVGDIGQLPPVKDGQSIFAERGCDVKLTTIERQAIDNPVIPLSRAVRRGDRRWLSIAEELGVPVFQAGPRSTRRYTIKGDDDTVFIAATNAAVDQLNRKVRGTLARGPAVLVPGERVMLQNSLHNRDMFNGESAIVERVVGERWVDMITETGVRYYGDVLVKGSDEIEGNVQVPVVRHAYAVTCHKAQGSEYPHVVVYLEGSHLETPAWLYTAITRASDRLTFVLSPSYRVA